MLDDNDPSAVAAVERFLAGLEEGAPELARSPEAAGLMAVASRIDSPRTPGTSISMLQKQLLETMGVLRALVPPKPQADRIDEVNRKREQRRARRAGA